jgi:hypothetical protein
MTITLRWGTGRFKPDAGDLSADGTSLKLWVCGVPPRAIDETAGIPPFSFLGKRGIMEV